MALYNNPIKQKSRVAVGNFVLDHAIKPFCDFKVFTLLGAETDEEVALEFYHLWKELGVPPENIWTTEKDPIKHARLLKLSKELGFHIPPVPMGVHEYFTREKPDGTPDVGGAPFDCIYLDYTGHQTGRELLTIRHIAAKGLLDHNGIFIQNHSAKREGGILKRYLCMNKTYRENRTKKRGAMAEEAFHRNASEISFQSENLRDISTRLTEELFEEGHFARYNFRLLETPKIGEFVREQLFLRYTCADPETPRQRKMNELFRRKGYTHPLCKDYQWIGTTDQAEFVFPFIGSVISTVLEERGIIMSREFLNTMGELMVRYYDDGYRRRGLRRWSYTSSTNTNMNLDAFAFSPLRDHMQALIKILPWDFKKELPVVLFSKPKELKNALDRVVDNVIEMPLPPREYLGSAFDRSNGEDRPNRQGLKQEKNQIADPSNGLMARMEARAREGAGKAELQKEFGKIPKGTEHHFRALKAWHTMKGQKQAETEIV